VSWTLEDWVTLPSGFSNSNTPHVSNEYLRSFASAWNLELVGESREIDRLDLMQISKRFGDIYRFYSTGLATRCCGMPDVPKKRYLMYLQY
jgi:hypothetical protein